MSRAITLFTGLFVAALFISISAMSLFSAIVFSLVLICWWFKRNGNESIRWSWVGMDWLGFGFIASVILSLFLSSEVDWAQSQSFKLVVSASWFLTLYLWLPVLRLVEPQQKVIIPFAFVAVLSSIWACVIPLIGFDPIRGHGYKLFFLFDQHIRTGGFLGSPMTMANVYAPVAMYFVAFFLLFRGKNKLCWWSLAASLLLGVAVFLTFTRGAWIAILLSAFVVVFLANRRLAIVYVAMMAVLGTTMYFSVPIFRGRVEQWHSSHSYDSDRVAMWEANLAMVKDKPLFGVGYDQNRKLLATYIEKLNLPCTRENIHAHNQFLHILAGTGVVGFGFYLVFNLAFLYVAMRLWRRIPSENRWHRSLALGALGALVCFQLCGITEANIQDAEVRHAYVFTLGILAWLKSLYWAGSNPAISS